MSTYWDDFYIKNKDKITNEWCIVRTLREFYEYLEERGKLK